MRAEKIEVEPFNEMRVIDYQSIKQVNEHANVKITGAIPIARLDEYIKTARNIKTVKITASELNGEYYTLLFGYLTIFDIKVENSVAVMTLEVKTGTCLMERSAHTRTFQDTLITYRTVLETCNNFYDNSNMIMTCGKESPIPEFIVQYKETDWTFIKRLASFLHTVVVPDTQTGGVKYYFGLPKWKKRTMTQTVSYKMCRDLEEFEKKKLQGIHIDEEESGYYEVESREIYEIGACVDYLEKELFIYRIESYMKGQELYHTYFLKSQKALMQERRFNKQIIGAALRGSVKSVKDDMVQISVSEDENRESTGYKWFPFSTVYSSPDGTGWYCMPECGDTVHLRFPSERASDAYVSSAVHEYSDERTMPEKKIFKNRQGKEICLAPDYILLTNNCGISVELSDGKGIRMKSNYSVLLEAGERISVTSKTADIVMNASSKLRLKQGDSAINISDGVSMEGMYVRLH